MKQFFQKIKTFFLTFGNDIKAETKILFREISDFFKSLGHRISVFFKKCSASIKKSFTVHKKKTPDESEPYSFYEECQTFCRAGGSKSDGTAADTENSGTKSADKNTQSAEENSFTGTSNTSRHYPIIYAAGNFFDILFDVLFAAGIILRLKPTLFFLAYIPKSDDNWIERFILFLLEKDFSPIERISWLPSEVIFTLFCIIAAYIIFKLIFALFVAHGPQKIVSVLLTALLVFTLTLTIDKFLIFLLFYFLLYFTYQLSCGISPKAAGIKLYLIAILDICMYLVLHIISFPEAFAFLFLPIKGWI